MDALDAALGAQAALLSASACVGAFTRAPPPLPLGYAALAAPAVALWLLWRRRWVWAAHALLTAALCVLCAWGAASARPIVRTVWRGAHTHPAEAEAQRRVVVAASLVLTLSTLLFGGRPGPTLLAAAFAIVTLNAAEWDWSAAFAFLLASALAVHLAHDRGDDATRVWGTPAAFELAAGLLTRPPQGARPAPRSASVWAMGR